MSAGADRVPIPIGARKMIDIIKEVAGYHSEDEIYAMFRDCAMDQDETTQKLLLRDTFHEVKRNWDKKKEGPREPTVPRWRLVAQGRGGSGNLSSRYIADGSHLTSVGIPTNKFSAHERSASESSISTKRSSDTSIHGKAIKYQGSETNQQRETPQAASLSSFSGSTNNRPSSNHSNHPQQINGS